MCVRVDSTSGLLATKLGYILTYLLSVDIKKFIIILFYYYWLRVTATLLVMLVFLVNQWWPVT